MKQLQLSKLSKSLQRNLYTFSTSTYGACVLVVFAFITLNSLLHVIQSFVGIGKDMIDRRRNQFDFCVKVL